MGGLGALTTPPAGIADWVREFRDQSNGGFQINLWIPDPRPVRDPEHERKVREFLGKWGPPVPAEAGDAALLDFAAQCEALLATRPIFHKTDAGIRGHVFCTFLALVLRKELIDRLAVRRSRLEWQRIVDDLADLSEIDVEQDGRRARLRTAPGPTIDPICRAIGIALPPVFQEMPPVP